MGAPYPTSRGDINVLGSLVTLWLCQNSYWKWPFIVDFPIKNCDFPLVMLNYQRLILGNQWRTRKKQLNPNIGVCLERISLFFGSSIRPSNISPESRHVSKWPHFHFPRIHHDLLRFVGEKWQQKHLVVRSFGPSIPSSCPGHHVQVVVKVCPSHSRSLKLADAIIAKDVK